MKRGNQRDKGFTLVELLVVIVIISMLAAFVAPNVFKHVGKARKDLARPRMSIIESAIARFSADCGRYPDAAEGLDILLENISELEGWNGPYIKRSQINDPWGNPYIYVAEGEVNPGSFDLISYGADGEPGGEGDDEDVYND